MRKTGLMLLALFLIALPVAALVVAAWPRHRTSPPRDVTRGPEWLKDLTRVENGHWRQWTEIVVHHSAGELGGLESIDRYHRTQRRWDSAGYHFIIGNGTFSGDGEIEISSRWETQSDGAHTLHHNAQAIGICLVGNFDIRDERPSPFQMLSLAQLVAYLAVRYDIPAERIYVHRDVPGAATRCPGRNFPLAEFHTIVEKLRRQYQPAAPEIRTVSM